MTKRWLLTLIALAALPLPAAEHVIVISVDGLRPAAIELLRSGGELPHFGRLQAEGAWTHNARADYDNTTTIPNHVSMVTGRPVLGGAGHGYTSNGTPGAAVTIHSTKGSYVQSVFDVAHDRGLATALHRSKSKLVIIDQSYSAATGAVDTTGDDDGRGKIDIVRFEVSDDQSAPLLPVLSSDLLESPVHLDFVHLVDPDAAGHGSNWETPGYYDAVRRIDGYLGQILETIEQNAPYAGHTTLILTADHGGEGAAHSDSSNPENYVVPLYVWGADVPVTGDLYAMNPASRTNPGSARVPVSSPSQPIRNADAANLALGLLGLPPITDSAVNPAQDLVVMPADGVPAVAIRQLPTGHIQLRWSAGAAATLLRSDNGSQWTPAAGDDWPTTKSYWVSPEVAAGTRLFRLEYE